MTLPPNFDEPALSAVRRLDAAVDRGQAHVFRVLWFWLPPGSVARDVHFQQLLASRFVTDIGLQALLFGTLIAVSSRGGTGVEAALLGAAYQAPGVLLGLYGGVVADALPKRVALAGAYLLMGAMALLIPTAFGTSFKSLLLVLFAVRVLHQVSHPSEASAVPLVASQAELASATSFLGLASSAGEVVGKAVLAPLIVRFYGLDPVSVVAGLLFLFAATRVIDLRPPHRSQTHPAPSMALSTAQVVRWLMAERTMLWMLLLGALGATTSVVLGVLGPQYTRDVLEVDPRSSFYVFAPAVLGLLLALAVTPRLIRWMGERRGAMLGFVLIAVAMVALGLVDLVSRQSWIPVFDLPRVPRRVEIAGELSVFLGFAITLAATTSQTYIARRVPLGLQGRTFALLGMMKDSLAIAALLSLGLAADAIGVRAVMTLSPALLLVIAFAFDRFAGRWRSPRPRGGPTGRLGLPAEG